MRTLKLATLMVAASLLLAPAAFACDGHKDSAKGATPAAAAAAPAAKKAEKKDAKVAEGEYVCPMGPECGGWQKQPGECAKCGMKLIHKSEYKK